VLLARIAETFHIPTYRLRCQAAELLSALCILSPHEGHNLVLSAISEMKGPSNNNLLRFQWLVNSLETAQGFQAEGSDTVGRGSDIDRVWDWRVAVLGLLNALANTPDSLEMRCGLRGELERRGLIMALEVCQSVLNTSTGLTIDAKTSVATEKLGRPGQPVRRREPRGLGRTTMAQLVRSGRGHTCCSWCTHTGSSRSSRCTRPCDGAIAALYSESDPRDATVGTRSQKFLTVAT